jgi:hypothetical protein
MVRVDCQKLLKVADCFLMAAKGIECAAQVEQNIRIARCQ